MNVHIEFSRGEKTTFQVKYEESRPHFGNL